MKKVLLILVLVVFAFSIYSYDKPLVYMSKSLLIPGWGFVSDGLKAGYAFSAVEATAIVAAVSFYSASKYYSNNSIDYASIYMNRDASALSGDILTKMELYISSDRYNELLPLRARDIYPDDPDKQKLYIEKNTIPDSLGWVWNDEEKLDKYYKLRAGQRIYERYLTYTIAGIVLNHVVSAISNYIYADKRLKNSLIIDGNVDFDGVGVNIGVKF